MVVEVDDVGKAREWLTSEARAQGMVVLPVKGVEAGQAVTLDVEDAGGFLEAARSVGTRVVYVTGRHYLANVGGPLLEKASAKGAASTSEATGADGASSEWPAPMRRTLVLLQDVGFVSFQAAFPHDGILHTVEIADREAWPAFRSLENMLGHRLEEAMEKDDGEEPDLAAMPPDEGARVILDYVLEQGFSRREMRRDSTRLAHKAVRDLVPDIDDLPAPARTRIHQAQQEAERRMRRGS